MAQIVQGGDGTLTRFQPFVMRAPEVGNRWLQMLWRSLYRLFDGSQGLAQKARGAAAGRVDGGRDLSEPMGQETPTLIPYRDFLAQVAKGSRPSTVLINRTNDAAVDTIERLLLDADKHMYILSKELCDGIFGQQPVYEAAVKFVRKGGELALLTRNNVDRPNCRFLKRLDAAHLGTKIRLAVLNADAPYPDIRFAVTDSNSFRFEPGGGVTEASVQFGEPQFAATLHAAFHKLWVSHARELELA